MMKTVLYNEDTLIQRFNEGEKHALADIYTRYFSQLSYFAYKVTNDMAEAEDIAAGTLEILINRYDQFRTLANIKAFVFITVRNRCLKYLEYSSKLKHTSEEIPDLHVEYKDLAQAEMVRTELMQAIQREVENLPDKRKEVFKLFYFEGLDINAIAQRLNMSPNSVYVSKSRAIDQLRSIFKNKLFSFVLCILIKNNVVRHVLIIVSLIYCMA